MVKIKFNIKYRPEIESGKYKVVTSNDESVKILTFERNHRLPILALINRGYDEIMEYDANGLTQFAGDTLYLITDEPEPQLSEFEKELIKITKEEGSPIGADTSKYTEGDIAAMHSYSERLLALARKQLQPEIDAEIDKAYKNSDAVQYRRGKEDALKDMPHWKHMYAGAAGSGDGRNIYLIRDGIDSYRFSPVIAGGDDYLVLAELDKLPKM